MDKSSLSAEKSAVPVDSTTTSAPDSSARSTSPFAELQRTLGNQEMQRLFELGTVQAKLRVSQPGDADEQEADRAADQVVAARSAPVLQRKCACGGTCSKCQGEEEVLHRSAIGPLHSMPQSLQRAAKDEPDRHPGETPSAVIVEDDAKTLAPGQMRKTEFVTLLQTSACATADGVLEMVGRTTKGCPYIKKWLGHYKDKDAHHILRAMHKYAPETRRARSAHEAIAQVNRRVERAALSWARTGKVSDLPEGIHEEMGGGFLGAVGRFASSGFGSALLGFIGGGKKDETEMLQRKSQDGASAGDYDATQVKEQLGTGQALDGRVASRMGSAFGYDFSGVRVHTDAKAGELSGQLNARAFTIGKDVAFAGGEYQPGTLIGDALIAHELAHVAQQGGGTASNGMQSKDASLSDDSSLEQDADRSAVGAVVAAWTGTKTGLANIGANALPRLKSGLKLQKCKCTKSPEEKEVERLGQLQFGFMENKRKADQEKAKKDAEENAKKKGLPPPVNLPKVDLGEVVKKDVEKHALKGGPTTEWDEADQHAWRNRAANAWKAVVASVKGTELEGVAKGVHFDFDPKAALKEGFYAQQDGHTLRVGMSWVRYAEMDPKNAWENLAHEMAGHFKYGETYSSQIMDSALSGLSCAERRRVKGDTDKFFQAYEYPETEIYASLWQRRYRVPEHGPESPSGGIHPDENIDKRLNAIYDNLHPEVAKAVLKELKRRIDANDQILKRDKDLFVAKVKAKFGYDL